MPLPSINAELPLSVLQILPNPVLVKNSDLSYLWVNPAFEELFGISCVELRGQLDVDVFEDRQSAQCNSGDLRVLRSGEVDEAYETVFSQDGSPRETITRKSRLVLSDGSCYLVGVMHDVTEVTRANEQLEAQSAKLLKLANTDALTGCLNRRALFKQAPAFISIHTQRWAVLSLDIDHFKHVNDTLGHDAGDAALVHFCKTVRQVLRKEDIFARLGGEEFVILLSGISDTESADIANRICKLVEDSPCGYKGRKIPMTVSIGAACNSSNNVFDLDQVLKQADEALYCAKKQGRNQVVSAATS